MALCEPESELLTGGCMGCLSISDDDGSFFVITAMISVLCLVLVTQPMQPQQPQCCKIKSSMHSPDKQQAPASSKVSTSECLKPSRVHALKRNIHEGFEDCSFLCLLQGNP